MRRREEREKTGRWVCMREEAERGHEEWATREMRRERVKGEVVA